MVKNPTAKAGDTRDAGSIPGLGISPGGGHGDPLQYLPGESQGQRSLAGYCPWSRKEWDPTERLHFHFSLSQLCPSFPILMAGVKFCTLLQYSHRSSYLDQTLLQILTLSPRDMKTCHIYQTIFMEICFLYLMHRVGTQNNLKPNTHGNRTILKE